MNKFIKEIIPYIVILIIAILIRSFIGSPVIVRGESMNPTLKDKEMLVLSKISYTIGDINRFDIVVIDESKIDKNADKLIIKRVIGLPGETVEYSSNKLYIDGKEVTESFEHMDTEDFQLKDICSCQKIPSDSYLVLGDNRVNSKDSRQLGLISKEYIEGKAVFRLFPFTKIGKIL